MFYERGKLRLIVCAHRSALEAMVFRCGPVCDATHLIICRICGINSLPCCVSIHSVQFDALCAYTSIHNHMRVDLLAVDIQGVSKMRGRKESVSPTKARKNLISIYVDKHVIFKVQPPRSPDLNHLDFFPGDI